MRVLSLSRCAASCWRLSGCGYHTVGAATHLPPDARTLSVPVFATRTEAYHTEAVMTDAVIREFAARTAVARDSKFGGDPDVVLARDDSEGSVVRR